jgi:hypothetical protein
MRQPRLLPVALVVLLALPAGAQDLGPTAPPKPAANYPSPPAGERRQGGETTLEAVELTIPAQGVAGTTDGYVDDYDEVCPYDGSTAPDVVYAFTPDRDMVLDIDLCGSAYDTKIFVYDAGLDLIACNDDFYAFGDPCGSYVSRLEAVAVVAGERYYLVIDGYGGEAGEYALQIGTADLPDPCQITIPPWCPPEGEPPLTDGYVDLHNGGCNSPSGDAFQPFSYGLHGKSGWYTGAGGGTFRDTDWFEATLDHVIGFFGVYCEAEQPTILFQLGPQDCGSVDVLQVVEVDPCDVQLLWIEGQPGESIWFWVGPQDFTPPSGFEGHEYDYTLTRWPYPVAVERTTFSEVKSLFR